MEVCCLLKQGYCRKCNENGMRSAVSLAPPATEPVGGGAKLMVVFQANSAVSSFRSLVDELQCSVIQGVIHRPNITA